MNEKQPTRPPIKELEGVYEDILYLYRQTGHDYSREVYRLVNLLLDYDLDRSSLDYVVEVSMNGTSNLENNLSRIHPTADTSLVETRKISLAARQLILSGKGSIVRKMVDYTSSPP